MVTLRAVPSVPLLGFTLMWLDGLNTQPGNGNLFHFALVNSGTICRGHDGRSVP